MLKKIISFVNVLPTDALFGFGNKWCPLVQGFKMQNINNKLHYITGALKNSLFVMCLGRFLFGIGGETLCVAQNTYAYQWFAGKELNLVFGLQLSMARIVRLMLCFFFKLNCFKSTDPYLYLFIKAYY